MEGIKYKSLARKLALALSIGMIGLMPAAQALPTGGSSTTATITSADKVMTITGQQANNRIDWKSFSIAKGETVNFDKNNYLNLVTGATKSQIDGALNGAGTIYLINPNGIIFGSTATVNVGSLVASTAALDTINSDAFVASGTSPLTTGSGQADIINQGKLQATNVMLDGKDIILTNTANITSDGSTPQTAVTLYANTAKDGYIDVGYDATSGTKATDLGYKGNTTINDCVLITDLAGLNAMKDGENYILGADIDASSGYTPKQGNNKTGDIFDGAGFTISGITVNQSGTQYTGGLFTRTNGDYIRNVTLNNLTVAGGKVTGGVVGEATNTTISNVKITGTSSVTGTGQNVGGFIGTMKGGSVTDSYNLAAVTGTNYVGGIAGYTQNSAKITNVYNGGNITGSNSGKAQGIGGIVGQLYDNSTVTDALNSGTITTDNKNAGGIAGSIGSKSTSDTSTASYVLNLGKVVSTGGNQMGSVAGYNYGTIDHAYSIQTGDTGDTGSMTFYAITCNNGTYGKVTNSAYYADTGSWYNGVTSGITKLSSSDIYSASTYADLLKDSNWVIYDGLSTPLLKTFLTTADAPTVTKTYNGSEQSVSASDYSSYTSNSKILYNSNASLSGKHAGTYTTDDTVLYSTDPLGYYFVGTPTLTINKAELKLNVANATLTYGDSTATYTDSDGNTYTTDATSNTTVKDSSGNTVDAAGILYTADTSSLKGSDTLESIQDDSHKLSVKITNGAISSESGRTTNDAGTYKITASDNGSTLQDYYVTTGNAGTATVNKAKATVLLHDINTTYGTAFDYGNAVTVTGAVNGDSESDVVSGVTFTNAGDLTLDGNTSDGRLTNNVGTYDLSANFNTAKNYDITVQGDSGTTAKATVSKATLNLDNLNFNLADQTYGDAFSESNYAISTNDGSAALVNGDSLSNFDVTYTNAAVGTNGRNTQDVGTYATTATLKTAELSNYDVVSGGSTVTGDTATVSGTVNVTPAVLTLTADSASAENGWASSTGYSTSAHLNDISTSTPYSGTVTGWVNGDSEDNLSGHTVAWTATDSSALATNGQTGITGSIDGSTSTFSNYTLQQASSNSTALTITPATTASRTDTPVVNSSVTAISSDSNTTSGESTASQAVKAVTVNTASPLAAVTGTKMLTIQQAPTKANGSVTVTPAPARTSADQKAAAKTDTTKKSGDKQDKDQQEGHLLHLNHDALHAYGTN